MEWGALPASVSAHVRTIVTRCLVKDRKKRIPDLSVVRYMLDDTSPLERADTEEANTSGSSVRLWQAVAAVLLPPSCDHFPPAMRGGETPLELPETV